MKSLKVNQPQRDDESRVVVDTKPDELSRAPRAPEPPVPEKQETAAPDSPIVGKKREYKPILIFVAGCVGALILAGMSGTFVSWFPNPVKAWKIASAGQVIATPQFIEVVSRKDDSGEAFMVHVRLTLANQAETPFTLHFAGLRSRNEYGNLLPLMFDRKMRTNMLVASNSTAVIELTSVPLARPIAIRNPREWKLEIEFQGTDGAGKTLRSFGTIADAAWNSDGTFFAALKEKTQILLKDEGVPVVREFLTIDGKVNGQSVDKGFCDPDYHKCRAPQGSLGIAGNTTQEVDFGDGVRNVEQDNK